MSDQSSAVSDAVYHALATHTEASPDAIFDHNDGDSSRPYMTPIQCAKDQLTSTVLDAIRYLPTSKLAAILLDTSLALIEAGQCGVFAVISLKL